MATAPMQTAKTRGQIARALRNFADQVESGRSIVTEFSNVMVAMEYGGGMVPTGTMTTMITWHKELRTREVKSKSLKRRRRR